MHLIAPADEWLDALHAAHDAAAALPRQGLGLVGFGVAHLLDGDGCTVQLVPFANTILDPGDVYVAAAMIRGISPAVPGAPSSVPNGMKLGTGSTAVSKAGGTGTALTTYLAGSNAAFDATYPQTSGTLGVNLGANAIFKTTWAAGTPAGTNTITEVVIVNDQATNATSTAANTFSRAVITSVTKTATDSLAITWNWKALAT
jgi:hypothetical protein